MSPIEAALVAAHFHDPRAEVTGATNAWGDHIGHTAELAAASRRCWQRDRRTIHRPSRSAPATAAR